MAQHSINPATGDRFATFAELDDAGVSARLGAAHAAAEAWRDVSPQQRAALISAVADRLDARRDELATLAVLEMGKTLRSARDEVAKCALACRHYAAHAPALLAAESIVSEGAVAGTIRYDPIGLVLAVMPWNFPYWQVIRAAAPGIAAGNGVVLKHASNVPQCAMAIESLFAAAGAPRGIFSTMLIGSSRVGALIDDPRIAAVTLTGSEGAGRAVAARAGAALKTSVLELGGSDPFIVLASADVPKAAAAAVAARTVNNGQSCIAAKRFIVVEQAAHAFIAEFVAGMRALVVGDPMHEATQLGPLATSAIRDELHQQVEATRAGGARLLLGGAPTAGRGFYYEPTVLADVPLDTAAARDELFGPVAPVFVVPDAAAALSLANSTPFGLGASVWTRDEAEAAEFTARIEAGLVFVNAIVASDPRFPFGGVKRSGYGRELGVVGLREFVNIKTVRGAV
jgi:succinate-semialdehyde dehydrogenase/glutarate-semialdehyde dehydrogenase